MKPKPAQENWYRVAICLHEFGQRLVAPRLQILKSFGSSVLSPTTTARWLTSVGAHCSILWQNFTQLGLGGPNERGEKEGHPSPLKRRYSTVLARLTWKCLQIGTDMLFIITTTGNKLLENVNIDDLEWPWTPKIGGLVIFLPFRAETRISRVNCTQIASVRSRQPAYEIFSIECRF